VVFKPRRQLLAVVEDGEETCTLRFFNFYPNMQKALEEGRQVRLRGEIRGGFMGRTCMHPSVQAAGGVLSTALTPVYSSTATMPQAYLRKAVQSGLAHALRQGVFSETIPAGLAPKQTWPLAQALQFLHHPAANVSCWLSSCRSGSPNANAPLCARPSCHSPTSRRAYCTD
jgi:ATP-dependent DNA helicase RecG